MIALQLAAQQPRKRLDFGHKREVSKVFDQKKALSEVARRLSCGTTAVGQPTACIAELKTCPELEYECKPLESVPPFARSLTRSQLRECRP